jgi:hypothetical protein
MAGWIAIDLNGSTDARAVCELGCYENEAYWNDGGGQEANPANDKESDPERCIEYAREEPDNTSQAGECDNEVTANIWGLTDPLRYCGAANTIGENAPEGNRGSPVHVAIPTECVGE